LVPDPRGLEKFRLALPEVLTELIRRIRFDLVVAAVWEES